MEEKLDVKALKEKCKELRKDILTLITRAGSGHPGGSLSSVEIVVTLYKTTLRFDPKRPDWTERDRFILSKGHGCPTVYAVLADCGFFPKDELWKFRKLGAMLQGHIDRRVPGVELSTGSLGQGLSVANGMALAAKLDGKDYRVYCLLGDGEIEEGAVWEAIETSGFRHLDNLCAILDANTVQQNGPVREIRDLEPLGGKIREFGWEVIEVDGHNVEALAQAYRKAREAIEKPTFIIARTMKGKGVSFMEGAHQWHGKAPSEEQLEKALAEIEAA